MSAIKHPLALGTVVWIGRYSPYCEVTKTCPVCFGKLVVHVILGDGTDIETPCDYCGKGFNGPMGTVIENEPLAYADCGVITSVTVSNEGVVYSTGEHGHCAAHEVFLTRAEALAFAEKTGAEERKRWEATAEYLKDRNTKSYSWAVGYHLREAKRCRKEADRHEEKAKICKERSRT